MKDAEPFDGQPMNLGVFLARSVFEGRDTIRTVVHDDDGDWIFRGVERVADADGWVLAHLGRVVELWPVVLEVADLPRGWSAERDERIEWVRYPPDYEETGDR